MRTLLFGIALLFTTSCAATSTPTGKADPNAEVEVRQAQAVAMGKELWGRCKFCHGEDGKAQTTYGAEHAVPDFTTQSWQRSRPYDELVESITHGCGPRTADGSTTMPPQEKLTDEEVQALAVFILTLGQSGT
ncbi:MAG: cytochrome c [Deltaproteobacteria bacterium]|nr:cytochrome c [Deltaproteobacteria bacterium]